MKASKFPEIDWPLYEFVQVITAMKLPISSSVIQNLALEIHDRIVQKELRCDIANKSFNDFGVAEQNN